MEESADVQAETSGSGLSEFRTERVRRIRERVASGSYEVDTKALADKILDAGVLSVRLPASEDPIG